MRDPADLTRIESFMRLAAYFDATAPEIYRYPALDEASFRRRLAETLANAAEG
ncbi:MAG: hypothetical protein WEB50_04540 [Vicinamibacterales bacterium]